MNNPFFKATRQRVSPKLGITGASGTGKTYSGLRLAAGLANGGRVALIDTENHSASLYSDKFIFDVLDIGPPFTESKFIDGLNAAVAGGYQVVILDSFSHAWQGVLDYKTTLDARGGNSYVNWGKAGDKFNQVLTAILQSPIHVIACMRSKTDYILEPDVRGKMVPRKVGMAPIMRDGIEYEFAVVFDCGLDHFVTTSKDRTGLFIDQHFQVTEETGKQLLAWLNSVPPESEQPAVSLQQQLADKLAGIHSDWITDFLIDRQKIVSGQSVMDLPNGYCQEALNRLTEFRSAIVGFGQSKDSVQV